MYSLALPTVSGLRASQPALRLTLKVVAAGCDLPCRGPVAALRLASNLRECAIVQIQTEPMLCI